MKHIYTLLLAVFLPYFALANTIPVTSTISPATFNETDAITITFKVDEAAFGVATSHDLYVWAWSYDTANVSVDAPTNGAWATPNSSS